MFKEFPKPAAGTALLIDGDNIASFHAARLTALPAHQVARVYGNARSGVSWQEVPALQFVHAPTGKNAADILIALDAMELGLTRGFTHFTLVSSDGDFTHLARRLRVHGCTVFGAGEAQAPDGFRSACDTFFPLDRPDTGGQTSFDAKIRKMIEDKGSNGSGMRVADLSGRMSKKHSTRISTHPERTWRAYLSKRPHLYDLDPRGKDAHVRLRPIGFDPSN